MPTDPFDFRLGDRPQLRKPHPCGSFNWFVVRLGADIGVRCEQCGRKVLLPRRVLEKRVKSVLERGPEIDEVDVVESAFGSLA